MQDYPLKERVSRICNVLETGEVMRFHATPSIPCQTVAHHAWGVAVFASFIKTDPRPDFIMEALGHDMEEFYTGDVPFTTKREIDGIAELLADAEDHYRRKFLFDRFRLTEAEKVVLKLADMLEGLRYAALNERFCGETQIVADRWFCALVDLFHHEKIELLDDHERERSYEIFRKVSPRYRQHNVYTDHKSFMEFHSIKKGKEQ